MSPGELIYAVLGPAWMGFGIGAIIVAILLYVYFYRTQ